MNRKFLRERWHHPARAAQGRPGRRCGAVRARRHSGALGVRAQRQAVAPPREPRTASSWCSSCPAATTGSTRWCPTPTTPTTGSARSIGIKPDKLRKIDDHFGFNPGMAGFERLYKDGKLAVVHGCGYDNPSFSHFTSMAYWHTAAPNSGEEYGWVGRLADAHGAGRRAELRRQHRRAPSRSRCAAASTCRWCSTIRTTSCARASTRRSRCSSTSPSAAADANASRRYLLDVARSAHDASALVREAWAGYKTPVDYGIVPLDLTKVAALIDAGMPTRLYYAAYRNNAFDTHVHQTDLHQRLLTYVSDAVAGFMRTWSASAAPTT